MTSGQHPEPAIAFTRAYFFRFVERAGARFIVGPFCVACRRSLDATKGRCGCNEPQRMDR